MKSAPIPENEVARLAELHDYGVLDTDPELGFDDLTAIAAAVCNAPIALVSLVDAHRQWFKSHHGLDATETPREFAFCSHAILEKDIFVVPDASIDERFHDNPLSTGAPHVRFYAGTALVSPRGFPLGTLCVIDHVPRTLSAEQLEVLRRLGRQVIGQLELRRARDQARAAAKAKAEFLATMSHEIRTPLNGVLGVAQLLCDTELTAQQKEYVEVVQRSGNHLLDVVNDILDFSRLEAGRITLESTEFDLYELANDAIAIMSDAARRKGIALTLQFDSPNRKRRGDPHRLRQTLLNFVSNAVKFTERGAVTVKIESRSDAKEVSIEVHDTGIGIAPNVLARLFERFTQADSSTTRQYGGTGLGLAITKQIVQLMGGEVGARSELGRGSCFWLRVPLPVVSGGATVARSSAVPSDECDLMGRSVLVVEDDATNRMVIQALLQKCNARVTTAIDGAESLALCEKESFDIILMDGMMPNMDGYEATGKIRNLSFEWAKRVPIIALTANALEGDRDRCLTAGMSDYVAKPIKRLELTAALARAIASRAHVELKDAVTAAAEIAR